MRERALQRYKGGHHEEVDMDRSRWESCKSWGECYRKRWGDMENMALGGQQGYEKNIQRGYWGEHTDAEIEERNGEGEKGRDENGA